MCFMETSEPKFYYIIREHDGLFAGFHTRNGPNHELSALGYELEPSTQAVIETIQEFVNFQRVPIFDDSSSNKEFYVVAYDS
jgi:hypothetical protein